MTAFQSIATFARVMRKWLDSIESGDFAQARFYSEQVKAISMLVALDPAFRTIFKEHAGQCDSDDPEHAARCIHAFISAATEAVILGRNSGRE